MNYQEAQELQSTRRYTYIRLGEIVEVTEDGRYRILFDGEKAASTKSYTAIRTGYEMLAGDRVACARVSGSWLILGSYQEAK